MTSNNNNDDQIRRELEFHAAEMLARVSPADAADVFRQDILHGGDIGNARSAFPSEGNGVYTGQHELPESLARQLAPQPAGRGPMPELPEGTVEYALRQLPATAMESGMTGAIPDDDTVRAAAAMIASVLPPEEVEERHRDGLADKMMTALGVKPPVTPVVPEASEDRVNAALLHAAVRPERALRAANSEQEAVNPLGVRIDPDAAQIAAAWRRDASGKLVPADPNDIPADKRRAALAQAEEARHQLGKLGGGMIELEPGTWKPHITPPAPSAWRPPHPASLFDLRDDLIRRISNHKFVNYTASLLERGEGTVNPYPADPVRSAQAIISDECARLADAQLNTITGPMTEYIKSVAAQLDGIEIQRADVPGRKLDDDGNPLPDDDTRIHSGLAVFDVPLTSYLATQGTSVPAIPMQIVAVSWGPTQFTHKVPAIDGDALWITFWCATDFEYLAWANRESQAYMLANNLQSHLGTGQLSHKRALEMAHADSSILKWNNEIVLGFGPDAAKAVLTMSVESGRMKTPAGQPTDNPAETTLEWVKLVRALFLLMQRPQSSKITHKDPKPRQERVAAKRRYNASPVNIVNIHPDQRPSDADGEHASGYKIGVRYWRKGHERKQPYAKALGINPVTGKPRTKTIWIDGTECGDPNAPWSNRKGTVHRLHKPPAGA